MKAPETSCKGHKDVVLPIESREFRPLICVSVALVVNAMQYLPVPQLANGGLPNPDHNIKGVFFICQCKNPRFMKGMIVHEVNDGDWWVLSSV